MCQQSELSGAASTAAHSFLRFFAIHTPLFFPTTPTNVALLVPENVFTHLLIVTHGRAKPCVFN